MYEGYVVRKKAGGLKHCVIKDQTNGTRYKWDELTAHWVDTVDTRLRLISENGTISFMERAMFARRFVDTHEYVVISPLLQLIKGIQL